MNFSIWSSSDFCQSRDFFEYCRFRELASNGDNYMFAELARRPTPQRPGGPPMAAISKISYLIDQDDIFYLMQFDPKRWAAALSHRHNDALHDIQQKMKKQGLEWGGTGEAKQKQIYDYLENTPPWEFITLKNVGKGEETYLVTSMSGMSPSAEMYKRIDQDVDDSYFMQSDGSLESRKNYEGGLHGNVFGSFDAEYHEPAKKQSKKGSHYLWKNAGYRGMSKTSAATVLNAYFKEHAEGWYSYGRAPDPDKRRRNVELYEDLPKAKRPRERGRMPITGHKEIPVYDEERLQRFVTVANQTRLQALQYMANNQPELLENYGLSDPNTWKSFMFSVSRKGEHAQCVYPYISGNKIAHSRSVVPWMTPQKIILQKDYHNYYEKRMLEQLAKDKLEDQDFYREVKSLETPDNLAQLDALIKGFRQQLTGIKWEGKKKKYRGELSQFEGKTNQEVINILRKDLLALTFIRELAKEGKQARAMSTLELKTDLRQFGELNGKLAEETMRGARLGDAFDLNLQQFQPGKHPAWNKGLPKGWNPLTAEAGKIQGTIPEIRRWNKNAYRYRELVKSGVEDFLKAQLPTPNRDAIEMAKELVVDNAMSEARRKIGAGAHKWYEYSRLAHMKSMLMNGGDVKKQEKAAEALREKEEELEKWLKDEGRQYARRMSQLDLGWGSRKQRKRGRKDKIPQAVQMSSVTLPSGKGLADILSDKTANNYTKLRAIYESPEEELEKALIGRELYPKSLSQRGTEEEGGITSQTIANRLSLIEKIKAESMKTAQETAKKLNLSSLKHLTLDDQQKLGQEVSNLASTLASIAWITEAAKMKHISNEVAKGREATDISDTELDQVATTAFRSYMTQKPAEPTEAPPAEATPSIEDFRLTKKGEDFIQGLSAQFRKYLDQNGNIMPNMFDDYTRLLSQAYWTMEQGEFSELGKKRFQAALKNIIDFYNKKHEMFVQQQPQEFNFVIRQLTDPSMLKNPSMLARARELVQNGTYRERQVDPKLVQRYLPAIKQAISKVA